MFIKIKGGKSEPQQKVKRKLLHQRRQKKGTRKTLQFPNQHYDTPRPKSQGICVLVASRRKAPWEVEVSKREEWRDLVAFEISEARRLENIDSEKANDYLQQVIGAYKKSKTTHTNDSQSTKSVLSEILEDKTEEEDLSFMFASRSFPGPLQCSNDMCRRKHPRAFLSDAGKVCKHCGGRDFNVGQQANSQDKGCNSSQSNLSFLDRYYFQREKGSSEDNGCSSSQPYTRSLDSHSQSSDKGSSEDNGSSSCLPNTCFLDRYFKREKGLTDIDKGTPELAVFPERMTTAEYMSRVQEVQRSREVLTMEEYFSKYGKK